MSESVIVKRDFAIGIILVLAIISYIYLIQPLSTESEAEVSAAEEIASRPVAAALPAPVSQELCGKYHEVKSGISCEDAVRIALMEEPGTVTNVSLGPVPAIDFSTTPYTTKDEIHWLVDIELAKPRFDSDFKKELKFLRVGIGLQENKIYREPIK